MTPAVCQGIRSTAFLSIRTIRSSVPLSSSAFDPDACIECGACAIACPVGAIFSEDDLTAPLVRFSEINARSISPGTRRHRRQRQCRARCRTGAHFRSGRAARTDIADHALDTLRQSNIREVVVLGRRGPLPAAYTSTEFLALRHLKGVDIIIDPAEIELDPESR
ncbi:4Fe-4S binding protein [Nocardia sp. NPDC055029]